VFAFAQMCRLSERPQRAQDSIFRSARKLLPVRRQPPHVVAHVESGSPRRRCRSSCRPVLAVRPAAVRRRRSGGSRHPGLRRNSLPVSTAGRKRQLEALRHQLRLPESPPTLRLVAGSVIPVDNDSIIYGPYRLV